MEKKYIYRKHVREPAKFFLIMGLMFIIGYAGGAIAILSTVDNKDKIIVGLSLLGAGVGILIFVSLEFLLIYFIMYKRFKKINVVLTEEAIIYNNTKGEIIVPYENIKALKFPSIKYTGGWLKIIHTNGNIRLTVVVENIGDLVKSLKDNLDKRSMSAVYNEKKIYKFFKTANYSDQSWERVYEIVKFLIIFIMLNLGVTAIFTSYINEVPVKVILAIGSVLGPMIGYFISEIIFGRKLAKGSLKESFSVPERDKPFEKKIYKWIFGIYTIIYFMVLIIIICNG